MNKIKRDINQLEEMCWYLKRQNFVKAIKLCKLKSDCFYKPTDVIERQIVDNINYDIANGTRNAYEYCRHLKLDLEIILEFRKG